VLKQDTANIKMGAKELLNKARNEGTGINVR